jgi:hypothetical protein
MSQEEAAAAETERAAEQQPHREVAGIDLFGNRSSRRTNNRQTPMEKATNAVFSTIGREVGRTLIRGILGSLKK